MTDTQSGGDERWSLQQAIVLVTACLMAGIAGGWMIRVVRTPPVRGPVQAANVTAPVATSAAAAPDIARLKQMADVGAAPLLAKLHSDPDNPDVLTSLGNLYYDAQQYSVAVSYYLHALKGRPSDAAVRTDLGTAYWYMGDPDAAIAELKGALVYAPDNPNTLFNLGLILWRGKADSSDAVAAWKKLLANNPNYEGRAKVEQMIAEAQEPAAAHLPQ